jgi:ABC-type Na+ efflux pump permease subunit/membrane protease YdiL (CAAX protease family)
MKAGREPGGGRRPRVALRDVRLVAGKELRETLRDRRTIAVMVLFPLVVYPVLSLVTMQVMAARATRVEAETARVEVIGPAALAAEVRARLAARGKGLRVVEAAGDASADVIATRTDAAAVVTAGAPGAPPTVRILFDETRGASREAHDRNAEALAATGAACAPLFAVVGEGIAPRATVGGYVLSKVLPLVVVVMIMLGAFHPAIDITAGERERGTLETTLSAPIDRRALMAGKVLAVATLAAITGILNLCSMSITVLEGARLATERTAIALPWARAASVLAVVPPAAFLFASVMVAVGTVARSFKEAQTLLTPIYFLCMAPSLTAALGDFQLHGIALVIPGVNVTLLARDLVVGQAHLGAIAVVFASTIGYGAAALALAARLYDSERLLGADEPGLRLGAWLRRLAFGGAAGEASVHPRDADADPTAGQALALYAMAWVVLLALLRLQARHLALGLLTLEWGGLLGLTVMFARSTGRPLARVLRLRRPTAAAMAGAILIGLSAWLVIGLIADWVFAPPKDVTDTLRKVIDPPDRSRGLLFTLFLTALTPAICEEALFRGPILRGLRTLLSARGAAIVTGLLFGLYHGDIWRFLPVSLLGALLSGIALSADSIVPAMAAHFVNNACLVLLARAHLDETEALPLPLRLALLAGGSAMLAGGFALLARGRRTQRVM